MKKPVSVLLLLALMLCLSAGAFAQAPEPAPLPPLVTVRPAPDVDVAAVFAQKNKQPFTRESLLEGAPERSEDSWQVPRVVK